ncbi:hypothetical protein CBL_07118 [Carabus blaptoides fortunei]
MLTTIAQWPPSSVTFLYTPSPPASGNIEHPPSIDICTCTNLTYQQTRPSLLVIQRGTEMVSRTCWNGKVLCSVCLLLAQQSGGWAELHDIECGIQGHAENYVWI